jgi:ParB-like chromosome segregation protein Spo0J
MDLVALFVKITDIEISKRRGKVSERKLNEITKSISSRGLMNPIIIKQNGNKYTLVDGRLRILALQELGQTHITAQLIND